MGFSFISIDEPPAMICIRIGLMLMVASIRFFYRRVTFMRLTLFDNPIFLPGGSLATLVLPTWGLAGLSGWRISLRRALGINHGRREGRYQSRYAEGQASGGPNCMRPFFLHINEVAMIAP
jgi:hypothetical protein